MPRNFSSSSIIPVEFHPTISNCIILQAHQVSCVSAFLHEPLATDRSLWSRLATKALQSAKVLPSTASKPTSREQGVSVPPHPQLHCLTPQRFRGFPPPNTPVLRTETSSKIATCNSIPGVDGGVKAWPQRPGGMVKNFLLREWARHRKPQHGLTHAAWPQPWTEP